MNEKVKVYDGKMTKTINNLDSELATIRAGRANPHVLDKLTVDYYGAPTPIQQVANVSVPEARMIQIQPWEKSMLKAIEKAIMTSEEERRGGEGSCPQYPPRRQRGVQEAERNRDLRGRDQRS